MKKYNFTFTDYRDFCKRFNLKMSKYYSLSFFSSWCVLVNNIFLVIYNIETNKTFIKYFNDKYEKNKMKNKIKWSKKLFIVEDSDDIKYTYEEDEYEN